MSPQALVPQAADAAHVSGGDYGILAILFALWLARDVLSRDTGTPEMQEIAGMIFEGAMAFLRRQYTTIAALAISRIRSFPAGRASSHQVR